MSRRSYIAEGGLAWCPWLWPAQALLGCLRYSCYLLVAVFRPDSLRPVKSAKLEAIPVAFPLRCLGLTA